MEVMGLESDDWEVNLRRTRIGTVGTAHSEAGEVGRHN
jgi:hypothetical protein